LLARPKDLMSGTVRDLLEAVRNGDLPRIDGMKVSSQQAATDALGIGPSEWVPARLLQQLVARFGIVNLRAVLPDGASEFWNPLVNSLLSRSPSTWEYFPSQIQAIRSGLLDRTITYSLQMPTGAGKTMLCETLLFTHLKRNPSDCAVLLVPYRSLASELRNTLVRHFNAMELPARCAYGGTVPSGDEVRELDQTRAMVATPEAISGLLTANPDFFRRISLVICDEGHLLGSGARGVGLELLLARMRGREGGAPRFVFVSAIVPNIEEINAWLGGTQESVVRSEYRPALAEYSVLSTRGSGVATVVDLDVHPHEAPPTRFSVRGFLSREDFQWTNPATGRLNTFPFTSVKTRAVAAARKAMSMGAAVVFAANKRGDQGAVSLAKELLDQLRQPLRLPQPLEFAKKASIEGAVEYLTREYGDRWVGTQALAAGAVLHHGDMPQETREVVEALLRSGDVRLGICTNTLAEGVNLPIRTLILYSVQRRRRVGPPENLLARDIKNLVGRAGRAGATTKGLVICANKKQWPLLEPVAREAPGERLDGALRSLMSLLQFNLARQNISLTNPSLEGIPQLYTLIDGIDATLVDLAAEEVGEDRLAQIAIRLADETFASRQADAALNTLLRNVFQLRARRIVEIRSAGRLGWVREAGARPRMVESVENSLLPRRQDWDAVTDSLDPALIAVMVEWAWSQGDVQQAVREAYRIDDEVDVSSVRQSFFDMVALWLSGARFEEMAERANLPLDDLLAVHTRVLTFGLQSVIEQGIALLGKLLEGQGQVLAPAVVRFPEHLRFGVPTVTACVLAAGGVRHRRAAIELGNTDDLRSVSLDDREFVFFIARDVLSRDPKQWQARLGKLVFENTLRDLGQ